MNKGASAIRTSGDERTMTVSVPLTLRRRGGRKQVVTPDGAPTWSGPRPRVDGTLVKALARAFRWRRLLEEGHYATVQEIACAEAINPSYVSRVLRLTLLAPEIVEAVLDGPQSPELTADKLMRSFPVLWDQQASSWAPRV